MAIISKKLRDMLIRHFSEKKKRMLANGSNCADVDRKLKELGYKEELENAKANNRD